MEEKIYRSMEHLRVLAGVSQGMLTPEDMRAVVARYQLDLAQQRDLGELLHRAGLTTVSPEERAARLYVPTPLPVPDVPDEAAVRDAYEALREARLPALLASLEQDPDFARQTEEELSLLRASIADFSMCYGPEPHGWCVARIVSRAVMDVSRDRIRELRKTGWVCGTHTNRLCRNLHRKLTKQFPEPELAALVSHCSAGAPDVDESFRELSLLLLDIAPRIHVNLRVSAIRDFCESDTAPA